MKFLNLSDMMKTQIIIHYVNGDRGDMLQVGAILSPDIDPIDAVEQGKMIIGAEEDGLPGFRLVGLNDEDTRSPPPPIASANHRRLMALDIDFEEVDCPPFRNVTIADIGQGQRGDILLDEFVCGSAEPAGQ